MSGAGAHADAGPSLDTRREGISPGALKPGARLARSGLESRYRAIRLSAG